MLSKNAVLSSELGTKCFGDKVSIRIFSTNNKELSLVIINNNNIERYEFIKNENIFSLELKGNFHGLHYYFLVNRDDSILVCVDPYAYACDYINFCDPITKKEMDVLGVFIDFTKTYQIKNKKVKFDYFAGASIYEAHVRDISSSINIQNSGLFLGITSTQFINHIKNIGYTHVQLMPINAFSNDKYDIDGYNWGYNPLLFLAIHPNYSTSGLCAINDFKKAIDSLHQKNIGVIVDVVFNHVFKPKLNPLDILAPNYYFLKDSSGEYTDFSGCGNDFNTNEEYTIKLYEKVIHILIKEYHVDGFRFDLMGLISLNTINHLYQYAKKMKKNIMIYGEGWDMIHHKKGVLYTTIANSSKTKVGFFNDYFRENVWSVFSYPSNKIILSLLNGSSHYIKSHAINYIACHDGYTLYDRIIVNPNRTLTVTEKQILLFSMLYLTKGHIFTMLGDDFRRTKYGHMNSYNEGDFINKVDYTQISQNIDVINVIKNLHKMRKTININNGQYESISQNHFLFRGERKYHIFINNGDQIEFEIKKNYKLLFDGRNIIKNRVEYNIENIGFYIFLEEK